MNKTIVFVVGAIVLVCGGLAAGWFLGQQDANYNPYQALRGYDSSRHAFMVKSSEVSIKMSDLAIQALKKKDIDGAIQDCYTSIDIFPINAKPYILLTKLYLMMGEEQKMYDTLSLAGRSYPNFDNIVAMIDDEDLGRIPLPQPQDAVYLANFPENKKTAITFMFDDGEANVYKGLPIFEKYGYRATIPVVAGFVAESSTDPFWGSWGEWKDAADRGFEIANHSMFHRDSKNLHGRDFDVSIDQAKTMIEQNTGHPVFTYVFPHDSYTDEAVSRALRVHKAIRTPEFMRSYYDRTEEIVLGGPHVSLETGNRLVDIAIERRLWLIMKCHGITNKRSMRSFKSITPDFLDANLAHIHAQADDIWVDTFINVFNYLAERSQTKIETKATTDGSIDFVLHNFLTQDKLAVPLTVVIKTPQPGSFKSAAAGGHALKSWPCDADKFCVDVDAYEEEVTVH